MTKWTCPFCNQGQIAIDANTHNSAQHILIGDNIEGPLAVYWRAVACVNPDCGKMSLSLKIAEAGGGGNRARSFQTSPRVLHEWQLIPGSQAKPQQDYVPEPLRQDYYEACSIKDLSPKASATLSRRCLQGMIRDFCGIRRGRLVDEINDLRQAVEMRTAAEGVTLDSMEAIDSVRSIGNIGAHMEKDIDLIVPVDPGEAQLLIELVETLFEEWYGARDKRKRTFAAITLAATEKRRIVQEGRAKKVVGGAPISGCDAVVEADLDPHDAISVEAVGDQPAE